MANPTISAARITPSREWLWVVPLTPTGGSALGGIANIAATGATITIDGVTTPLTLGVCNHMLEGFLYPLCPTRVSLKVDDSDARCLLTGTWTENVQTANASNGQFHESTNGTSVWTYMGLTPGRYRLSAHLWDFVGPDRTTDAVYTVRDGAGASMGVFHRNLQTTLYPTSNRTRFGLNLHDLGYVTLAAGQDRITVTLTNGAGSGKIFADAMVLESAFISPAQTGSTITASFPAVTVTVSGVPTDEAIDLPVTFLNDADWIHPIHAPEDRTLKVGYNFEGVRQDWPSVYLADRSLACDVWMICTVDAHFEMTANAAGTAQRELIHDPYVGDLGLTPGGMYLLDEGVQRFEFNVSGATFDAAARAAVGLIAMANARPVFGAKTWTDLGGGRWRLEIPVSRPTWQPISARSLDFKPRWGEGMLFVVPVAGLVVTDWKWFDSRVPIGWDKVTHPDIVANYKDKVKVVRSMDVLGTNSSPAANPGDYTTSADRATPVSGGTEAGFRIAVANVVALHPVDFDPTTDPHQWHRHFVVDTVEYWGWYVLELDRDAATAGIAEGVQILLDGVVDYPSTLPGVGMQTALGTFAWKLGGNFLLVICSVDLAYLSATAGLATLTGTQTPVGGSLHVRKNHLLPPETFFDICADINAEPWVNFSAIGTDAYVDWLMDMAIAGTPDGRAIHGEFSNETWNAAFGQFGGFSWGQNYGNWQHSQDPITYPLSFPTNTHWIAHRALQLRARCRARLVAAGRDPDLLVWHFGSVTQNPGFTDPVIAQVVAEGEILDHRDCLTIEAYQDNRPPGGDYSGPDTAATWARLSVDGMIDLLQAATFHGSRKAWADAHRSRLDTVGFTTCKISGYETGWAYIAPDGDPMHVAEIAASPRMYLTTASEQSSLQDAGYSYANKYADTYYSNVGNNVNWTDFTAATEGLGTGDPAENPNAVDYPNIVSQVAGGRLRWASGFDFAATPTPTPTPTGVILILIGSENGLLIIGVA